MRIAYVDDTKQRGRREDMGQLVALGAAIFDEAQVQPFAQAFRAVYDEFSVPHDVELKWSNSQRRNWWAESEVRKRYSRPCAGGSWSAPERTTCASSWWPGTRTGPPQREAKGRKTR